MEVFRLGIGGEAGVGGGGELPGASGQEQGGRAGDLVILVFPATASPPPGFRDHVTSRDIQRATLGLHEIAPTCRQPANFSQRPQAAEICMVGSEQSGRRGGGAKLTK